MNRQQFTSFLVAAACMLALGVTATSLSSSVTSSPSTAVDLRYDLLPIDRSAVADLNQRGMETEEDGDHQRAAAASDAGGATATRSDTGEPADGERTAQGGSAGQQDLGGGPSDVGQVGRVTGESGADSGSDAGSDEGPSDERGDESDEESDDGLVGQLAVGIVVVGLLALLYRYRDELRPGRSPPSKGPDRPHAPSSGFDPLGPPPDENVVYLAWHTLVADVPLENPAVRTAHECAREAKRAGKDPVATRALRRTFEEVRYGAEPVTQTRAGRVREATKRLELDVPVEGP